MSVPNTITIDGVEFVRLDTIPQAKPAGNEVIVRTDRAGVHIGELAEQSGQYVKLTNARRLWSWAGAFTLNEVSQKGVTRKGSRISAPVPIVILLDAIEILPVAKGVDLSPTEK